MRRIRATVGEAIPVPSLKKDLVFFAPNAGLQGETKVFHQRPFIDENRQMILHFLYEMKTSYHYRQSSILIINRITEKF